MIQRRGIRVAILVEDRLLERFARRVLTELGFASHELRVIPGYPHGKGSGKQWVAQQYLAEVPAQRRAANHQKVALLVGTDADNLSVDARARQLADALKTANEPAREAHERIIHWIPKWSIETWLLHLLGNLPVDETKSLKKRFTAATRVEWNTIATKFVDEYHNRPSDTLPSLSSTYSETDRL
jgi:hypothetical protein